MLRTNWNGIEGFIGYGFGYTKKKIKEINTNPETGEEEWYFPKYDRTHQLNIVESFNISEMTGRRIWGSEFTIGTTYSFGSGQPERIPEQIYFDGDDFTILYSYKDRIRLPNYSRFDVSIKMKWEYTNWSFEPYIQIINMFKHKNIWSRSYQPGYDEDTQQTNSDKFDSTMFPRIPFIGFNIEW